MTTTTVPSAVRDDEIDLLDVFRVIWRQKLLVAAITLAPMVLATGFVVTRPKLYQAQASILPVTRNNDSTEMLASSLAAQMGPVAATLGGFQYWKAPGLPELLASQNVARRVVEACRADLPASGAEHDLELADQVRGMVQVSHPPDSRTLLIQVEAGSPQLASKLANAYVTALQAELDSQAHQSASARLQVLEQRLADMKQALASERKTLSQLKAQSATEEVDRAEQELVARKAAYGALVQQREAALISLHMPSHEFLAMDQALPPTKPRKSKKSLLLIALATMVGLTGGLLAAFLKERLDGRSTSVR